MKQLLHLQNSASPVLFSSYKTYVAVVTSVILIFLIVSYLVIYEAPAHEGSPQMPKLRLSYFLGDHGWGYQSTVRTDSQEKNWIFSPINLLLSPTLGKEPH